MPSGTQLRSIIISGGGTGGHIFPAIAIADEIRRRYPDCDILFVGAEGRMEMQRVPAAGYPIVGLPIRGIQRRLTLENVKLPGLVLASLLKARRIIKERKPQAAVGVGGYASGPMLWAARGRGVPFLIQEQNSHAGLTNKLLAPGAAAICTAWPGMERFFKNGRITLTGNPVRAGYAASILAGLRADAHAYFGLQPDKPVLLITGGSLGARTINEATYQGLPALLGEGLQIVWQTGKNFIEKAKILHAQFEGAGLWVSDFIGRMDLAYAAADLVVARAGALTISELCLAAKPAILVPSPNVAEDHQTANARALAQAGGITMLPDLLAQKNLVQTVKELLHDAPGRQRMSENLAKLAMPNATSDIVDVLERIALA